MMNRNAIKKTAARFIVTALLSSVVLSAHAEWRCFAADKGGHTWMSAGLTQEHATTVAHSFCTAYSPNSASCHVTTCTEKS